MDYSLLIGVVRRRYEVVDQASLILSSEGLGQDEKGAFHAASVEGPGSYYMGVIDILQEWNFEKKLERFFKVYFKFADPDGLSAIEPTTYQRRFMERAVLEVFESSTVSVQRNDRRFSVTPISSPPSSVSDRNQTSTTHFEVHSPLVEGDEEFDGMNTNENYSRIRTPSVMSEL